MSQEPDELLAEILNMVGFGTPRWNVESHMSDEGRHAGSKILVAHAGDSRAMLCTVEHSGSGGGRVQAVVLTEDHSPGAPEERARILAAGGTMQQDEGTSHSPS